MLKPARYDESAEHTVLTTPGGDRRRSEPDRDSLDDSTEAHGKIPQPGDPIRRHQGPQQPAMLIAGPRPHVVKQRNNNGLPDDPAAASRRENTITS